MSSMEFEPTIPASEGAKSLHALDRAATVTCHLLPIKLSRVLVKRDGDWIANRFVGPSQFVTTTNYNTLTGLRTVTITETTAH
jgi:hypothetical protein